MPGSTRIRLALVALLAGLWWYRTRSRAPLAAVLFFAGTLFPALGFVNVYPFIYSFVADHFQYLASLGIIVLISAGVATLARQWQTAVSVAIVVPLALVATNQSRQYADAETLYRTTLARNPSCWMAYINLGKLRQEQARAQSDDPRLLEEAATDFREALRLEPSISQAHNNLGTVLLTLGKLDEAQAEFQEALKRRPGDPEVQYNLGLVLQKMGRSGGSASRRSMRRWRNGRISRARIWPSATRCSRSAGSTRRSRSTTKRCGSSRATRRRTTTSAARWQERGRMDEAVAQYLAALEISPRSARASTNLGLALVRLGRMDEALKRLRDAVSFDPAFVAAHYNLANALAQAGRLEEAVSEFAAAVKLQPNEAALHNELGIALAETGRLPEAIAEFREAIRLKPDFEDAKANLARAIRGR